MGDGEVAGVAHRFDLPHDPGGAFWFDGLAPERAHGLNEFAGWAHLEVLSFAEQITAVGRHFETATGLQSESIC